MSFLATVNGFTVTEAGHRYRHNLVIDGVQDAIASDPDSVGCHAGIFEDFDAGRAGVLLKPVDGGGDAPLRHRVPDAFQVADGAWRESDGVTVGGLRHVLEMKILLNLPPRGTLGVLQRFAHGLQIHPIEDLFKKPEVIWANDSSHRLPVAFKHYPFAAVGHSTDRLGELAPERGCCQLDHLAPLSRPYRMDGSDILYRIYRIVKRGSLAKDCISYAFKGLRGLSSRVTSSFGTATMRLVKSASRSRESAGANSSSGLTGFSAASFELRRSFFSTFAATPNR